MASSPTSIPSLLLLLLLLLPLHPAAAEQHLASFSAADSPWMASDDRTLVSPNQTFAAGFLPDGSSAGRFFWAIWVRNASSEAAVWSLNQDVGRLSALSISRLGVLTLNDSSGRNIWPAAAGQSNATKLVLREDGNLVFGNWTSFAAPTSTILANQPLPSNGTTLSSGEYQLVNGTQLVFNGSESYWSASDVIRNLTSSGELLMDNGKTYYTSDVGRDDVLRRLTLDPDGNLRIYSLRSGRWRVVLQAVDEPCTISGTCGANAVCKPTGPGLLIPACECLPGFRNVVDGGACVRKQSYLPSSAFLRLDFVNFTDGPDKEDLTPLDLGACRSRCLANLSCVGFSYKFTGDQTCFNHYHQLVYGYWSPATEAAMFLRVSSSETDQSEFTGMTSRLDTACPDRIGLPLPPKESKTTARNLAIICALFALELLAGIPSFWAFLRKYAKYRDMARTLGPEFLPGGGGPKRFSYEELKKATDDFATSNVIGRGGYGDVYKGVLPDRRVIAVKRLRKVSGGEAMFWAEVTTIARMHHLNLVRMWGFCADQEQRMLVYEYISNGSLDKYLFQGPATADDDVHPDRELVPLRPVLDWNTRYRIALGVARAVAYLHEECLEWVLHCDIKPENILLEDDFCPKVADFGLSKLTTKKDHVTMSGLRGTRGYLAPEWLIRREPITAKADVYSFGVVLLEIVSGVRNSEFQRASLDSGDWFFARWAFEKAYVEKKVEDILDRRILDSFDDRAHVATAERMVKTAM